jgi:hypothetical protein
MSEAIVGINSEGMVRAVFAIDKPKDEKEATKLAGEWLRLGRTVKRCGEQHAFDVLGKEWKEPQ